MRNKIKIPGIAFTKDWIKKPDVKFPDTGRMETISQVNNFASRTDIGAAAIFIPLNRKINETAKTKMISSSVSSDTISGAGLPVKR